MAEIQGDRLDKLITDRGLSQSELARRVGIKQPSIARLISGHTRSTSVLLEIARELRTSPEYLIGETDDADASFGDESSKQILSDQLDLVALREIDLNMGLGATYLDVPVTETTRYFSREWIRQYTRANPDHLFFAQGIGDSQTPTILDSDLLLIDASQKHLTLTDKFWAIAYAGTGGVKRLRNKADGSVEMLCDNALVPNDVAYDGELEILGRVVGIVRRM